ALYREAVLLSAESEEKEKAQDLILKWEKIINELSAESEEKNKASKFKVENS
ncbi:hypothetical protein LCGC14_1970070, partial [marine sediment metagenome]